MEKTKQKQKNTPKVAKNSLCRQVMKQERSEFGLEVNMIFYLLPSPAMKSRTSDFLLKKKKKKLRKKSILFWFCILLKAYRYTCHLTDLNLKDDYKIPFCFFRLSGPVCSSGKQQSCDQSASQDLMVSRHWFSSHINMCK